MNNFNRVASFYDALARIVFKGSISKATNRWLEVIDPSDRVLILGGGTGKILEQLPICANVTYLEKSSRMIQYAKRRKCDSPVSFLCKDFLTHDLEAHYNVIISPFFLDCFDTENLERAILKIKGFLVQRKKLIIVDFDCNLTSKFQDRLMHLFFRITVNLESRALKDIRSIIAKSEFVEEEIQYFNDGIFSAIYTMEC